MNSYKMGFYFYLKNGFVEDDDFIVHKICLSMLKSYSKSDMVRFGGFGRSKLVLIKFGLIMNGIPSSSE